MLHIESTARFSGRIELALSIVNLVYFNPAQACKALSNKTEENQTQMWTVICLYEVKQNFYSHTPTSIYSNIQQVECEMPLGIVRFPQILRWLLSEKPILSIEWVPLLTTPHSPVNHFPLALHSCVVSHSCVISGFFPHLEAIVNVSASAGQYA